MALDTARHLQSWTIRKDKVLEKLRQVAPNWRNSLRSNHIKYHFWRRRPQKPITRSAIAPVEAADKVTASSLPPSRVKDPMCSKSDSPTLDGASWADARNPGDLDRERIDHRCSPRVTKPQAQAETQSCPHSTSSATHNRNESNAPVSATMLDQSPSPRTSDQLSHGAELPQPACVDEETTSGVRDRWSEMHLEHYQAPPGQQVVRIKPISFVNPDPRISQQEIRPVSLTTTSEGSDDEPPQFIVHMAVHKPGVTKPEHTTPRRGLLDTGSNVNVVSAKVVDELNMTPWCERSQINTLGIPVTTTGVVTVRWHVDGRPEKLYYTQFWVIPPDIECAFDFLIGSSWIRHTKALIPNREFFFLRHTQ